MESSRRYKRLGRRIRSPSRGEVRTAKTSAAVLASIRREGEAAGAAWRSEMPSGSLQQLKQLIQRQWASRWSQARGQLRRLDWRSIWSQSQAFGEGALQGAGFSGGRGFTPLPLQGSAAAVMYADPSSGAALPAVLGELIRLPLAETILVAGDVPEEFLLQARSHEHVTIASLAEEIDADVGRALGAKLTGADIVLFVDARKPVSAELLARFLWACDEGLDVALNDLADSRKMFQERSPLAWLREFLNATLGRSDLRLNMIGSLPFALSRNAIDTIGSADLAVPAKAQAAALLRGLKIGTAGRDGSGLAPASASPAADAESIRMLGDHFEAWQAAAAARGFRLRYEDRSRDRRAVGGVVCDEIHHHYPDE
ncbi:hypothetical protein COLU111180_19540 [Cohnella lubricantis]|uniref:Uncharacterized protein n=1 Tax=Cohnella lubricantis TaxID=2163172 RepID=A0A841TKA3_9BACL|nr:hypothetical protein [Cohnella lubricantis]MBB6678921.1 hypothetical protein [Cohnella lubricantis]MBP2120361.1 hypothetical protein [Cohnella lubricantis]